MEMREIVGKAPRRGAEPPLLRKSFPELRTHDLPYTLARRGMEQGAHARGRLGQ